MVTPLMDRVTICPDMLGRHSHACDLVVSLQYRLTVLFGVIFVDGNPVARANHVLERRIFLECLVVHLGRNRAVDEHHLVWLAFDFGDLVVGVTVFLLTKVSVIPKPVGAVKVFGVHVTSHIVHRSPKFRAGCCVLTAVIVFC